MEYGVVGRTTEGFFRYQAWPTVAKDANGVIYAAASGHRLGHVCPFGKDLMYISRDDGKSWEGPIIVNDTYMDDRDAGLCTWGDGNIVMSWFTLGIEQLNRRAAIGGGNMVRNALVEGAREMWKALPEEETKIGAFVKISKDGGKSWSERIRVPVTSPHGPTRKADGSLLFLGKEKCWGSGLEAGHIYTFESKDGGYTWEKLGYVELPEGFEASEIHEPHAIELPDGTILGGLRVSSPKLPGRNGVFTTFSYDGGKTFTKPQLLDICGTPPHFLLHSSGAIVLTYGRRIAPCEERAVISWDGGKTWSEEITVSQEAPDWDLGYPSSIELSDGSIMTVYYQKYPGDSYNSILYTKWELPRR